MSIVFSKLVSENNIPLQSKTVSPSTSLQEITPDQQYYGLSKVTVNPVSLQNKSVQITENGTTRVTVDDGYNGMESIDITTNVAGGGNSDEYINMINGIMNLSYVRGSGIVSEANKFSITPDIFPSDVYGVDFSLSQNPNIASIEIPNGINTVRCETPYCNSLKYIEIYSNVANIDAINCSNLKYVNAPNIVFTNGGHSDFKYSKLNHIKMPQVYSIASSAFYYCENLKVVDFRGRTESTIPYVSSTEDFAGVPSNCKVVIPDELYSAWTNWGDENRSPWYSLSQSLTYVKESEYETDGLVYREESGYIGDNGEYVWDYVFTGIGNSEDMDITIKNRIGGGNPSSYRTIIANNAFENNENLLHITMPSNLYQINSGSFSNCTNLKSIDFSSTSRIPIVDSYSFHNVPKTCKFIIPSNLYDSWITSPVWDTLYNEGYNFVRK